MSDGTFDDQNNHFSVSLMIILILSVSYVIKRETKNFEYAAILRYFQ